MNIRSLVSLAAVSAVFLCSTLVASAAETFAGQNQPAMQAPTGALQISTLIGSTVLNVQGQQKVGQIKDVLLDPQTGQATFVILDAEIPGSGRAMLVVPYQALQVGQNSADNHQTVQLDLRPDRLQAAPQIRNNEVQMLRNPQFLQQARDFYQPRTYTAARPIDNADLPPMLPPCPLAGPDSGWSADLDGFYNE